MQLRIHDELVCTYLMGADLDSARFTHVHRPLKVDGTPSMVGTCVQVPARLPFERCAKDKLLGFGSKKLGLRGKSYVGGVIEKLLFDLGSYLCGRLKNVTENIALDVTQF